MLIDRSYFIGELNIPESVDSDQLDVFIQKYEPLFLRDLLGELYAPFVNGLTQAQPDAKWTELLYGDGGEWRGLVETDTTLTMSRAVQTEQVTAGGASQYDPAAGTYTVQVPASMMGKPFTFGERFAGTHPYTVSLTGLMTVETPFVAGKVYEYRVTTITAVPQTGQYRRSMIANYIYFMWMRNQATQSTSVGEVSTAVENGSRTSLEQKMVAAWNDMVAQVWSLRRYMYRRGYAPYNSNFTINAATYRGVNSYRADPYRKINIFGI